ncbi:YesN/AraC family two-component response regulator [Fontibacillus solani]|uniref:YesN/AraC family two-component response regulator n=1 Tax=Fontibacillus solani TaxID=1572857 RepID=A0A7W3XTL3_9BACL|nr:response regulator [Fontibacillus solani]MBA9087694.1 YesN/AraC family two-component response regulator [Fontibacillus solani]
MIKEPYLIVIADDELHIREGLASYHWDRLGFQVVGIAKNGKEALHFIETMQPHVLLTDIKMPVMDGIELLKKISETKPYCKTIILTGYKEFEYARSAIQYGAINYLLKPFELDELEAVMIKIRNLLDEEILHISEEKDVDMGIDTAHFSHPIRESVKYIREHYGNKITLDTIANQVHLNASYFSTLFKQETKMNFVDYLKKYRLEQAKRFLLNEDLKVFEIANRIGIQNANYFTEVFKEYTGLSPLEFRKRVRNLP